METRSFKMHPALLFSVIQSQAGTQGKALLEGVMNSIDAGASRVEVDVTAEGFRVEDDGKGFADKSEIVSFFETFGQPHQEGDAIYGRFRMGRGQMFSFGVNHWETGRFVMDVDIKNDGLDYRLKETETPFPGCKIVGQWYDPLRPSEIDAIVREVKELVAYAQIPVYLNGQKINTLPSEQKWDVVTDDAYIKLKESGGLAVYNLGVLVRSYPGYQFGTGGIVVSRNQLNVNFARNDVLVTKCEAWKRIQSTIKPMVSNKISKKSTRLTEDEKRMLVSQICSGELAWEQCRDMRLLTDINGNHFTMQRMLNLAHDHTLAITSASSGSKSACVVHDRGIAFVISNASLDRFGVSSLERLVEEVVKTYPYNKATVEKNLKALIKPFNEVSSSISEGHAILDDKELDKDERRALNCLNRISDMIQAAVSGKTGICADHNSRRIFAGMSDVAEAWTDGRDWIAIHRRFLKQLHANGYRAAQKLVLLLVHEYLHNDQDAGHHQHDEDFYREFHDIVHDSWYVPTAIENLVTYYAQALRKDGKRVTSSVAKTEDAMAATELEKAKALGFSSVKAMYGHMIWLANQKHAVNASLIEV